MWNSINAIRGYLDKNSNQYLYIFVHVPKCAGGTIGRHFASIYGGKKSLYLRLTDFISERTSEYSDEELRENRQIVKTSWIKEYIRTLGDARRNSIQSIYGHIAYYGIHEHFNKNHRYFTFLREPVARFISLYNYMLTIRVTPERLRQSGIQDEDGRVRSLDEWIKEVNLVSYSMTGFLAQICNAEDLLQLGYTPSPQDLIKVKKMLESFYFVGLTENDDDMQFVYNRLGVNFYKPDKNVLRIKSSYILPSNMEAARELILSKYPYEQELYEYAVQLNHEMKSRIKDFEKAVSYTRFRRNISKRVNIVLQVGGFYKAFDEKARHLLGKISPAK